MYRTTVARTTRSLVVPARSLHSSPATFKTVIEKAKEVTDTVNMNVGQGLASAIDKGENVAKSAKETIGIAVETTKEKSQEVSTMAQQKGHQAATGAREAKEDLTKEVKK